MRWEEREEMHTAVSGSAGASSPSLTPPLLPSPPPPPLAPPPLTLLISLTPPPTPFPAPPAGTHRTSGESGCGAEGAGVGVAALEVVSAAARDGFRLLCGCAAFLGGAGDADQRIKGAVGKRASGDGEERER